MRQIFLFKKWFWCGFFAVFTALSNEGDAQSLKRQVISSYGSSGVAENIWFGQTAGQSFHTAAGSIGVTVSQGFQQPVLFSLKEIGDPVFKNLNILVYPNPASRSVTITSEEEIEQSVIAVTDINGKYMFSEKIPNLSSHTIQCASWANGVYLITIYDSKQNLKTLRLIISN